MRILIGNQKGGTGKTTVAILIANYLSTERERRVAVLDLAAQKSIWSKAEKARILENRPPYTVQALTIEDLEAHASQLENAGIEIILIDLPTEMKDDGLINILRMADLMICPFAYDEFTVEATIVSALLFAKINTRAPVVFLPNRIKTSARYEVREEVNRILRRLGTVAPSLADRVDIQRITTISTPEELRPLIAAILDLIYEQYIQGPIDSGQA